MSLPKGVITAALTPLNADLSVNHGALINHLNWLLNNGSDAICFLGTTGEANSFSVSERKETLTKVISGGIAPEKLMVGTGCCSYPDTVELTRHAVSCGVGGILMLPPFYYKNLTDEGVLNYFDLIIRKINHPDLRIYLYHFPKMTSVPFTPSLIQKLVAAHPEVIIGMKDSSGDFENMKQICAAIPGFQLYAGTEKYLLDTLRIGGMGSISATANLTVGKMAEVYADWQTDLADSLQDELTRMRMSLEVTSFVSGLKYLLSKWRNDESWLNVRPPNTMPDLATVTALHNAFENLGLKK